jgi:phosphoglucosamine mutase
MSKRKYFGTDGVRGRANEGAITSEFAVKLGRALGSRFANPSRRSRIAIGKDTRLSGYMLETALASGIVSSGCDVVLVGPLPTPGIAFVTEGLRCDAGIVISASHNPYTDNGIKLFDRRGYKLDDAIELEIEDQVDCDQENMMVDSPAIGYASRVDDAVGRYIVSLKSVFPKDQRLDGVKIVVDCAHGACYKVSPAVFRELGATVVETGVRPNGMNINSGVGALHPEHAANLVKKHKADLGVALDGDGDRLVLIDSSGTVVDGDALLALCAGDLLEQGELNQNTMVATVMSNLGLEKYMEAKGGKVLRSNVGDRYVMEQLRNHDLNFGGENSGHVIFRDHGTTGDGTLAALQVLSLLQRTGRDLTSHLADFEAFPQRLEGVRVREKMPLDQISGYSALLAEAEKDLNGRGRTLIRYSGTEPKLRIMVEADDPALVDRYVERFVNLVTAEIGE